MKLCPIHNLEMKEYWKKEDVNHTGESWHSHKLDNGDWCNGKPPRAPSAERPQLEAKVLASIKVNIDTLVRDVQRINKVVDWLYRHHEHYVPEKPERTEAPPF